MFFISIYMAIILYFELRKLINGEFYVFDNNNRNVLQNNEVKTGYHEIKEIVVEEELCDDATFFNLFLLRLNGQTITIHRTIDSKYVVDIAKAIEKFTTIPLKIKFLNH
jgi:hypothetical protein